MHFYKVTAVCLFLVSLTGAFGGDGEPPVVEGGGGDDSLLARRTSGFVVPAGSGAVAIPHDSQPPASQASQITLPEITLPDSLEIPPLTPCPSTLGVSGGVRSAAPGAFLGPDSLSPPIPTAPTLSLSQSAPPGTLPAVASPSAAAPRSPLVPIAASRLSPQAEAPKVPSRDGSKKDSGGGERVAPHADDKG